MIRINDGCMIKCNTNSRKRNSLLKFIINKFIKGQSSIMINSAWIKKVIYVVYEICLSIMISKPLKKDHVLMVL